MKLCASTYVMAYLRCLLLADYASCCFVCFFCFLLANFALLFSSVCVSFYFAIFATHKHIVCCLSVVYVTCSIFIGSQTTLFAISYGGLRSHIVVEYSVTLFL